MASDNSKISYFNTLIFTIVSGIISLVLIVMLFFPFGKGLIYMIVTMEIGIFSVIGVCLFQIIKNELYIANMKKNLPDRVSFSECPDYYIRVEEQGVTKCKNNYIARDVSNNKTPIRIYPSSVDLPKVLPQDSQVTFEKFNLYEIEQSNKLLKEAREECAVLDSSPMDTNLTAFKDYSKIPWTHARARCGPYMD